MSDDRQLPEQQRSAQHEHGRPERAPSASDTTVFSSIDSTELEIVAPAGMSGDARAAVYALPPTSALLIMQRGPSVGARFLLDAERTVAGRSPDADIFLDDVTVSRKHAEFVREGDDFVVRDIGSLNGTYVNRNRIDATALRPGDEVQIGKYRMTFHPSPARATGGEPAVHPL
ncbi:FHA domain-containing protein [Cellulomonas chengniuliangii]|uniref:FHA domain-containing protein n=1 Tax=Cellulomonas chengniuliangii TaxID=2968084 RepID=A0ABY5KVV3_9CELL|nr:FHA domain-containing protein [Cellulomonas chengniuliangii]MCC2308494.1 FHA domain-containing protein [Cellulomonas chengniuliangii]MCC2317511.1 FHA domain-containing protein [Cellulomonas chengniuliangii]UUI73860.1 FHA domain-containing protein [Cellulomonas chengniuliangii]